jgi:hypothetical protein
MDAYQEHGVPNQKQLEAKLTVKVKCHFASSVFNSIIFEAFHFHQTSLRSTSPQEVGRSSY